MNKFNYEHQYPLVGHNSFLSVDFATLATQKVIGLPAGAQVISGWVVVVTPYDSATSAVLDVGDAALQNRYANDIDLKTAGRKNLIPTGFLTTAAGAVTATLAQVGAATVGEARVYIEYIVARKADEIQD
ncbi:MAG: hypothetical protein ACOH2R_08535 [Pseudomonas sp.]